MGAFGTVYKCKLCHTTVALKVLHCKNKATDKQFLQEVFTFADKYRGSYNDSLGPWVCSFYCDFSGYQDELLWGAAWLHRATKSATYFNYVQNNINILQSSHSGGSFAQFGWDAKHAGIYVCMSKLVFAKNTSEHSPFAVNADKFVCSVLPESPTRLVSYSPGGLILKAGGSNLQHSKAISFLLLVYARYSTRSNRVVHCGNVAVNHSRLLLVGETVRDVSEFLTNCFFYHNHIIAHMESEMQLINKINNVIQICCSNSAGYYIIAHMESEMQLINKINNALYGLT